MRRRKYGRKKRSYRKGRKKSMRLVKRGGIRL